MQIRPQLGANKPAVILHPSGTVVTFDDLEARANRLAHRFRQAGLREGDTVADYQQQLGEVDGFRAVVVGAPAPSGSTSTGKASPLPTTGSIIKPPSILVSTSGSTSRPAQGDATDSAIASLGKSYNGLFF